MMKSKDRLFEELQKGYQSLKIEKPVSRQEFREVIGLSRLNKKVDC